MSNTNIQTIQLSKNFGKISKVVFFQLGTNVSGFFKINLYLTPSQTNETSLSIINKNTKSPLYSKKYAKSANTNIISDIITIKHDPTKSTTYGLMFN
jgi:hypothetical protein